MQYTTKYYVVQRNHSGFYLMKTKPNDGPVYWCSDRQYAKRYHRKGNAEKAAAKHWGFVVECEMV